MIEGGPNANPVHSPDSVLTRCGTWEIALHLSRRQCPKEHEVLFI